eukprot:4290106-Prymnesium_polylepis.1
MPNQKPTAASGLAATPEAFLEEALTLAAKDAKNGGVPITAGLLRRRIAAGLSGAKPRLSWQQAISIAMDVLPPTTRTPWPAVTMSRAVLPRDHSLHLDMQTEWYFFETNGFTTGGDRFYMVFLFQVLGGTYAGAPASGSQAVRALSIICAATLVPASGAPAQRFESWKGYPFVYSRAEAEAMAEAAGKDSSLIFYSDATQRLSLCALHVDGGASPEQPVLQLQSSGTSDVFSAQWLHDVAAGFSFGVSQD